MPDFSPAALSHTVKAYLDAHQDALTAHADPSTGGEPAKSHVPMHAALALMAGGQAWDGLSTQRALDRYGTHEANPIYGSDPSLGRILATKAAIFGPLGYALDKMYDKHPKTAATLAGAVGALGVGLALHNRQQGR